MPLPNSLLSLLNAAILLLVLGALPLTTTAISRDGRSDHDTISIYGWPLNEQPTPIALIKLDPLNTISSSASASSGSDPSNRTATLFNYQPSKMLSAPSELIRVGILEPVTKRWSGSVVGRDAFDAARFDRRFTIYYDRASGRVWHVQLAATEIPRLDKAALKKLKKELKKKNGGVLPKDGIVERTKGETTVKVVVDRPGPQPVLNKPVVLSEDGKVEGSDVDNRTFLQKYWWAIALFLLVNVLASGGAPPEEKS